MSNLPDWENEAASAAVTLCTGLSAMDFGDDLQIGLIPTEEANGHNELDVSFLESLKSGAHLDDGFLSGI